MWIARSAKVAPTAFINGPAIIGKDAEVRHCAFIRGNAIVGEGAVVGNSTELKNVAAAGWGHPALQYSPPNVRKITQEEKTTYVR